MLNYPSEALVESFCKGQDLHPCRRVRRQMTSFAFCSAFNGVDLMTSLYTSVNSRQRLFYLSPQQQWIIYIYIYIYLYSMCCPTHRYLPSCTSLFSDDAIDLRQNFTSMFEQLTWSTAYIFHSSVNLTHLRLISALRLLVPLPRFIPFLRLSFSVYRSAGWLVDQFGL